MAAESLPERVARLFRNLLAEPEAEPLRARLDRLPFSLHLVSGASSVELFPPGPLDVLRFYQRHHASLHHDLEYVVAVPEGAAAEDFLAYAAVRFRPEDRLPLLERPELEASIRRHYGTLVHLPRARPLLERPYSDDLRDGDPPEGPNRVLTPRGEKPARDRFSVAETLEVLRRELTGPELVSWLELAFPQRPPRGRVEHRYYLDATARLFVVRDHSEEGKSLYCGRSSPGALRPERP